METMNSKNNFYKLNKNKLNKNKLRFSEKQLVVLSWWCENSKFSKRDAIICDGAIRSGKSFSMFLSFVFWAFENFSDQTFAICGKTITSVSRNLITPMISYLNKAGYICDLKSSKNRLTICHKKKTNTFFLFGGKDEGSSSLIQGITLAGALFDEVVLMPQSFVEQALARCSLAGSKFWFNCNPQHPNHWFYQNWILKSEEKNALYLSFKMSDNLSLNEKIIARYKKLYSDSFYKRFVEGIWCAPDGLVYPSFDEKKHVVSELPSSFEKFYISCDYGTVNPFSLGLWGLSNKQWFRIKEYYYSSRASLKLKTDEEYYQDLLRLAGERKIEAVIIDPSAASFSQTIISHQKFKVIAAKNDIIDGISKVSQALSTGAIRFGESCVDSFREFSLYCWNNNFDLPKKENDHAMDEIRYFVNTVVYGKNKFGPVATFCERKKVKFEYTKLLEQIENREQTKVII